MIFSRESHTATALASGQVLVTGGYDIVSGSTFSSAEEYMP
jgi:hypothetical protein